MSGSAPLYCETAGQGPDLVLVHGWGLHGGVWDSAAAVLAERFRVTRVDLPGHGRSPLPAGTYTLDGLAAAVAAVAPPGATWIGWSLGGLVSLAAAAAGAAPRRLVLVATTPRFVQAADWPHAMAPEVLAGFAADLARDYRATLLRFLALQSRGSERAREELKDLRGRLFAHGEPRPEALEGGLAVLRDSDLRPVLPQISVPTLWLHGARDNLSPAAAAAAAAGMMPRGSATVLPGAGHAPFLSHPGAFCAAIEDFLHD